ncbi:uncharacterized SAM-binding protein YcdF (DUF218 family) [Clostridium algifaecis]|uniref:Uncharacterized SAM-binding protein YcdF (DUF218 family) n=1 Tax=Clostridium algifaecis TaxID=1472040 RepID=A0ABS4KP12_9CLOT|nr:YdcF family protein [Clostridium algifaecis]MBP2031782.1 uncharacterized SAM-binding protein YcdF (DUF218 family) [Clostridium algifaecis]
MKNFKNQMNVGYLLVIFGIVNILYFLICCIVFNRFVNFSEIFIILGTAYVILGIFKVKLHKNKLNKLARRFLRVLKVFICIICVSFIFIEGCIFVNANIDYHKKPDYIMILGAGISGKNMLLVQLHRTEEGLKYIKKNPGIKVIVSGGQGSGEDISEAEAMRIYLVQHGVNNGNIIKEEKSKNTIENMKYTSEILRKIDGRKNIRLAIVTSNFHVFRAKFLAKRCGFQTESISSPVNYLLLPNYCVREYFGIIKSFIFDR